MSREFDGDVHEEFNDSDRNSIRFVGNKIYSVQTCHIYYTSYDLQRQSDTVNPCAHPDIMLRSPVVEDGAESLNPTGMEGLLGFITPMFGPRTQKFEVAELPDAWISFGFVGLATNQVTIQDFVEPAYPKSAL